MPEHRAHTVTKLQIKALVVIGIIAAAVAASIYYNRGSHVLIDATSHQPTRFTELYFNNPASLPVSVPHGDTLPVSFTVHNLEARDMSYPITVSLIGTSGQVLAQKQQHINLASTVSKSTTALLTTPANYHGTANVQVTLDNLHQSIHFKVRLP